MARMYYDQWEANRGIEDMETEKKNRHRGTTQEQRDTYAAWLRQAMATAGMTLGDLATKSGLGVRSLDEYVRGAYVPGWGITEWLGTLLASPVPEGIKSWNRPMVANRTRSVRDAMEAFQRGTLPSDVKATQNADQVYDRICEDLSTLFDMVTSFSVDEVVLWMQSTPFSEADRARLSTALWVR